MHEWALVLFTLLMQTAIGMVVAAWFYQQFACSDLRKEEVTAVLRPTLMTAFVVGILGGLASVPHLGNPLHAFYTIMHAQSSWMSREILFTGLFIGLLFLTVLLLVVKRHFSFILLTLTAIAGLVDIYAMSSIYYHSQWTMWNTYGTYAAFYGSALLVGGLLSASLMLMKLNGLGAMTKTLVGSLFSFATLGVILGVIGSVVMLSHLGEPLFQGLIEKAQPDGILTYVAIRYVLIALGMIAIGSALAKDQGRASASTLLFAFVVIAIAEVIGRYIFFILGG